MGGQSGGQGPADINGPTQQIAKDQLLAGPIPPPSPMSGMVQPPPPTPTGPWQPVGFPPGASGHPPPPAGKRRVGVILSAIAVIVAAVIGVAAGLRMAAPHRSVQSVSKTSAPDPMADGFTYRLLPATVLPDVEGAKTVAYRVQSAEPPIGRLSTPTFTTPPTCSLEYWPYAAALWGTAMSTAAQAYTNLPEGHTPGDDSWHVKLTLGAAVFRTSAEASATLAKLTDSVNSCTMTYTDGTTANVVDKPEPTQFTVDHRESTGTDGLTWEHTSNLMTVAGESLYPLKTAYVYRVVDNLAVLAMYVSMLPEDESSKAVDLLIANANARNHR